MKISIIIPVYNKERYVQRTLTMVQNQNFRDFECIVVDDGSTDQSGILCDQICHTDDRFSVIHTTNQGVSRARNLGISHSKGEYLTFIDADDSIEVDYLETLYVDICQSGADIVIGNLKKYWANGTRTEDLSFTYNGCYNMSSIINEFAYIQRYYGIYGFCVAKLLKRELIHDIWFDPELKLAEDLDFYLRIYPRVKTIYFEPEAKYWYLQEAENSSMTKDDQKDYYSQLIIQLRIISFLKQFGAFSGENRTIMISRVYDYIYFCWLHTPSYRIVQIMKAIHALDIPRNIHISGSMLKVIVLTMWNKGRYRELEILKKLYSRFKRIRSIYHGKNNSSHSNLQ